MKNIKSTMKRFISLMKQKDILKIMSIAICVLTLSAVSYAYFTTSLDNTKNQTSDLSTGTMSLIFSDNDNGINESLSFGQTTTKKFKLQNTGTLEASASMDWVDMINTYLSRSLTFNLTYSETEDGEYKILIPESNVPVSNEPITQTIDGELSVPAGETYYYNLNITLNSLPDVDQTPDLSAVFITHFKVGQPKKYRHYKLNVDPNGGTWNGFTGKQEYLLKNGETKEISEPTRIGYEFGGWELKGASSTIEDGSFKMGISDATLTAKWNKVLFNLTIDPAGGTYPEDAEVQIAYGETVEIATPTREGYTFTGWKVSSGSLNGSIYAIGMEDATLTATWIENEYKYIVYHSKMNTDGVGYTLISADTEEGEALSGTEVSPEPKIYTGFTSPVKKSIVIQKETVYPPVLNKIDYNYTRNRHTLSLVLVGGIYDGMTEYEMYYDTQIQLGSPTKEGYNFLYWTHNNIFLEDGIFAMQDEDATAVAVYEAKRSTVTFNPNGGTLEMKEKIVSFDSEYGDLPVPEYNDITGYEFLGWYTDPVDGEKIEATTIVSTYADQTLYAHWNASKFFLPSAVNSVLAAEVPDGVRTVKQNFDGTGLSLNVTETGSYEAAKDIYYTYSDDYTYDIATDTYSLINPKVCIAAECPSVLKDMYLTNLNGSFSSTAENFEGSPKVYKVHITTDNKLRYYAVDYVKPQYIVYGDSYSQAEDGEYVLSNPQSCNYAECFSELVGKYTLYYFLWDTATIGYKYKGNSIYQITNATYTSYEYKDVLTEKTYKKKTENEFSNVKTSIWNDQKDTPIYYFKGSDDFNFNSVTNKFSLSSPTRIYNSDDYTKLEGKFVTTSVPGSTYSTIRDSEYQDLSKIYYVVHSSYFFVYTLEVNDPTDVGMIEMSKDFETADGYVYDQNEKAFRLNTSKMRCSYESCYNDLVGKYFVRFNINDRDKSPNLYRITATSPTGFDYEVLEAVKTDSGTYDPANNGVYAKADTYGTSYYYRGSVTDNYVKFANKYWRVVRVNGDGSVRLIYDGTNARANGTTLEMPISTKWATADTDAKYLGYMYGPSGTTASTSMSQAQTNTTASLVKTSLNTWYANNLLSYATYIQDAVFCNDRSIPGSDKTGYKNDTGLGYAKNVTGYAALARFVNTNGWISREGVEPILTCPQKNDAFTVSDTTNGNAKGTRPIGLITADEVILAGGGWKFNSKEYYLYTGNTEWTMTSFRFSGSNARVMQIADTGELADNSVTISAGIRPVINIKAEYAKIMNGNGTRTSPYQIPGVD